MKHEQYTQKLRRILTALETESFKAIPRARYVFGSYSRGAPEPGDLDLLFVYDLPASHEKEAEFWSQFFDAKTFKREFLMQYVREFNAKLLRRGEQNRIMYDEGGALLESIRAGGWIPTFHVRKDNALFIFERGPKWSLERNARYPD